MELKLSSSLSLFSIVATTFAMILMSSSSIVAANAQTQVTFNPIQNLTNNPTGGVSSAPVVAAVGSNVYAAWETKLASKSHVTTYFSYSNNNGGSWSTPFAFSGFSNGANTHTSGVQIAAEGNYVFLTWSQGPDSAYAISSDSGVTWTYTTFTVPSTLTGTMSGQAVAACGTYAYFTWADSLTTGAKPILFVQAHDTGSGTFSLTTPVSISGSSSIHGEDEVACYGNNVYVVWDSIYLTTSLNNGGTVSGTTLTPSFNTPQQIKPAGGSGGSLSREPMVAASGPTVYVTFPSDSTPDGSYQTFVVVCTPTTVVGKHGTTVSNGCGTAMDLSYGFLTNTREVQVAARGSNVYITTRGQSATVSGTQQYVYVSNNNGVTWNTGSTGGPPNLLAPSLTNPENGFGGLAIDGSNVYVFWQHNTMAKGVQQMILAASQDNGVTWAQNQQVSQSTGGANGYGDPSGGQGPMVAAASGNVYTVWQDNSTGNADIYFASGTV